MGKYLQLAEQALLEESGVFVNEERNQQFGADRSARPKSYCEKSELCEISLNASDWSKLLENKNGELEEHQIPVAGDMVAIVEMRERGIVPDHYTAETECKHCGPVPIFKGCPPQVINCPWCLNRIKGLPMPNTGEIT